jgi:hypothetical protein
MMTNLFTEGWLPFLALRVLRRTHDHLHHDGTAIHLRDRLRSQIAIGNIAEWGNRPA